MGQEAALYRRMLMAVIWVCWSWYEGREDVTRKWEVGEGGDETLRILVCSGVEM